MGRRAYESLERAYADLSGIDAALAAELCRVRYARAHSPLEQHTHEGCMEFVLFVKGAQVYTVGGAEHTVRSGEVFFTRAGEPHGTSGYPEDKSVFYYLIVNVGRLCGGVLGLGPQEEAAVRSALETLEPRVFKAGANCVKTLDAMLACCFGAGPFRATALRNLLSAFLLDVLDSAQKSGGKGRPGMRAVLDHIERNIDSDLSVPALAEFSGLSVPGFKARFRSQTGIPPREYVLRRRVERAKVLLEERSMSVTDISFRLGFSSSQYFATVFKRFAAMSPGEYRAARGKTGASGRMPG